MKNFTKEKWSTPMLFILGGEAVRSGMDPGQAPEQRTFANGVLMPGNAASYTIMTSVAANCSTPVLQTLDFHPQGPTMEASLSANFICS